MYTLEYAYVRGVEQNSLWVREDIGQRPIKDLETQASDVWLFVTYPSLTEPKAFRLQSVKRWLNDVGTTVTVNQWLTSLGNTTLPFADEVPDFETRYVRYTNAWHAGYQAEPITRIGTVSQKGSKWDKEDLLVWRDDLDPQYLTQHALFTVNGLFHFAEYGTEGVHLHEGNATLRRSNDNQIGVYSFAEVGQVSYVPITVDMCRPVLEGTSYRRGLYVTLGDDIDLENKTVLAVVGGYLYTPGKAFVRTGDRSFRFNLDNLGRLERYYDSVDALGLHDLGITEYESNPGLLDITELQSDAFLKAYMGMSQTFFVVVDCPMFFHQLEVVEQATLPGRFYDRSGAPQYPLVGAYGRMLEHSIIHEDGVNVLCATLNYRQHYDFHHYPWTRYKVSDAGRLPSRPYTQGHAYYRVMGTQK